MDHIRIASGSFCSFLRPYYFMTTATASDTCRLPSSLSGQEIEYHGYILIFWKLKPYKLI